MHKIVRFITLLVLLVVITACYPVRRFPDEPIMPRQTLDVAPGWQSGGAKPMFYAFSLDPKVTHGGKASASIKAIATNDGNAGAALGQMVRADKYQGQRIRLSGYIKTAHISGMASLYMQVEDAKAATLTMDNGFPRMIMGDNDWQKFAVVLDVPANAHAIIFGALIGGIGQMWFDDLQIEVVGQDVASTAMTFSAEDQKNIDEWKRTHPKEMEELVRKYTERYTTASMQPVNLDFEQ